ncbi:MAG: hypothetical protein IJ298_01490 [Ruminococcus sp.]|nr:hypothetical protein [Ruminococcus sp.]
MKRLVSAFLAIVIMLCLACCTQDTQDTETGISRGSIKGNTYTSKYTGLKFTKPDDWRFLSDKELAQAMSISEEAISDKEFAASLEEYPSLVDMMVMDDASGLNLTVGYENLTVTMGGTVTEAEYMDAMTEYLQTMGNMTVDESIVVKLSGQDYLKTSCSVEIDGVLMKTDYYIRVIDTYMTVITAAYTADVTGINIEAMFS